MKKIIVALALIVISFAGFSQDLSFHPVEKRSAITIGVLQGGGGIVGADLECLLTKQMGIQFGAGLFSFGAGLNYHFKPSIRSSFVTVQYWHQGFGEAFAQSAVGPSFVYRSKKWFTCQLGLGLPLEIGPAMPSDYEKPPVILLYSIGAYIPF